VYATAAEGLTALGYIPEEDPKWDKDFGAVGAILIGENGELLTGTDPREETTALGK
jgi:gamma-glutamyltranspeptidase / glutathione hydrolase